MNNEIKKNTREKILTLLDDLQSMSSEQIATIAISDSYFGLAESIDADERSELLEQDIAMMTSDDHFSVNSASTGAPSRDLSHTSESDGYQYIEYPESSGIWFYRTQTGQDWSRWE